MLMHFRNMVLAGGGPLTLRFIGCIEYLEHTCIMPSFSTFVGTSAGAMLSLMLVLGMRSDDMLRFIKDKFVKRKCHELDVNQVIDFAETWGLDNGSRIMAVMSDLMSTVTGSADMTFMQLAKHTGKNLVICVSNVSLNRHEFMSLESSPDMSVLTSLRMSMSVPVVFTPVHANSMVYVDGGLFNNFPIDYCCSLEDCSSSGASSSPASSSVDTLGLDISFEHQHQPDRQAKPSILSITEYFVSMMCAMISRSNTATREFYGRHLAKNAPNAQRTMCTIHGATAMMCDRALVVRFANANSPGTMFNFSVEDMRFDMSDEYLANSVVVGYDVLKDAMRLMSHT